MNGNEDAPRDGMAIFRRSHVSKCFGFMLSDLGDVLAARLLTDELVSVPFLRRCRLTPRYFGWHIQHIQACGSFFSVQFARL